MFIKVIEDPQLEVLLIIYRLMSVIPLLVEDILIVSLEFISMVSRGSKSESKETSLVGVSLNYKNIRQPYTIASNKPSVLCMLVAIM